MHPYTRVYMHTCRYTHTCRCACYIALYGEPRSGIYRVYAGNLPDIHRASIGNPSNIYRTTIGNLSNEYQISIEYLSSIYRVSKIYRVYIGCLYPDPIGASAGIANRPQSAHVMDHLECIRYIDGNREVKSICHPTSHISK